MSLKRVLTILFTDLEDLSALTSRLGAEELNRLIETYRARASARIRAGGGVLAHTTGDRLLAYFDAQDSVEANVETAIETALAIAGDLSRVDGRQPLHLGFGIATGEMVVVESAAPDAHRPILIGDAPAIAARLQSLAVSNSVVISSEAHDLAREQFVYRDLGLHALSGSPSQVQAYGVLARRRRIEQGGRVRAALVGRADELRHLEQCWRRASSGHGNVVVISGEAGIGKSRLASELESVARADHALIMRFQCSALQSNSVLHPIQEHLNQFAGVQRAEPEHLRYEKIRRMLALSSSGDPPEGLVSSLVAIGTPSGAADVLLSPRRRRDALLQALLDGITDLAVHKPLVLILEDAQWLDPTSEEFLERIVSRVAMQRLLVVVTARREYDPGWIGMPHTSIVIPRRLSRADTLALAQRLSEKHELSPAELVRVVDRSEGVPLFVEELSRENAAVAATPPEAVDIPASLHALLTARLDRVGPAKQLAQIAAALGRRFGHDIVARISGGSEAEFAQMIAELMAAEIVLPKPIRQGTYYSFRHVMLQEAAYASLSEEQRLIVHAKIVKALAADAQDTPAHQPEIMAHHCERAGLDILAAGHWLAAGKTSAAHGAIEESITYFKRGLDAAGRGVPGEARERLEFELNMNLGPALMALKGYASDEGLAAFLRARKGLSRSRSSLEEIHVMLGLFNVHFGRGDFARALEVGNQADRMLTVGYGGYPVLMGQALCMMGELVEARSCLERALLKYDPTLDADSGLFCRADVVATSFLAKVEFALGNLDRSIELTNDAMQLARQQGHPLAIAIAYLGQLFMATETGGLGLAQALADEALDYVTEHNLGNFRLWVAYQRAALSMQVDAGAAIATMHQVLEEADATGTLMFRPAQLGLLGVAYARTGRTQEALALIDRGLETARKTRGLESVPALRRLRAKTLLEWRPAEAIQELEASLAIARSQSARLEELRSATLLARMLKDTDRREYANAVLASVYGTFTQGHHFADLKQAARVLASFK